MNIFVIGATGRIGSEVLKLALQDAHFSTAFVRSPGKLKFTNDKLSIFQGNVLNEADLLQAMSGSDIVISALSTDGTDTLSKSITLIVEAMKIHTIERIITIGTAGILKSRNNPNLLRYQTKESRRTSTFAAEEHYQVYKTLNQSGLAWTIVCPAYLTNESYTGLYRTERDFLPENGNGISIQDTAEFTYKQIKNTFYLNTRVGITY